MAEESAGGALGKGSINVPGIGQTKTVYVVVVVGLAAGVVGYAWWKRSQAAAAPATIVEEFDEGALADDTQYGGGRPSMGYAPVSGEGAGSAYSPSTNAEWTQKAQEALVAQGFDPPAAATALGKYLARQPLTEAEANMVRYAIGYVGNPPQGSYTVVISTTPPTGSGDLAAPTGLAATNPTATSVNLSWSAVVDADGYRVYGPNAVGYVDTTTTELVWSSLEKARTYQFAVAAKKGTTVGPKSSPVTATTLNDTGGARYFDVQEALTFPVFQARLSWKYPDITITSMEQLKALNPGLTWAYSKAGAPKGYVPAGTPGAVPTFGYNATLRVA